MRQQGQGRQARRQERLAQVTPAQLDVAVEAHHRLSGRLRSYPGRPFNPTLRHWVVNVCRFERFRTKHEWLPDHAFELSYHYDNLERPVLVPWDEPELYDKLRQKTLRPAHYVRF